MKKIIGILILCIPLHLFAANDFYQFDTPTEQNRFATLTSQLRCLVCQNQNLAESNAALAVDLRQQIYEHIQQGQSDKEIIDYLVERYGNFILYRPPFVAATWGLWLGPLVFLLVGIVGLLFYIHKKEKVK